MAAALTSARNLFFLLVEDLFIHHLILYTFSAERLFTDLAIAGVLLEHPRDSSAVLLVVTRDSAVLLVVTRDSAVLLVVTGAVDS